MRSQSTQSIPLNQLRSCLQQHLQNRGTGADRVDLSFLAHGEANVIFRLNHDKLVRVAVNTPNQRYEGDASRVTGLEATILNYLDNTPIGQRLYRAQLTPPVDFPYTYLITNYLAGDPLNYSRKHLRLCAETLATLHRLPLQTDDAWESLATTIPVVKQPLSLFYQEAVDYAQSYLDSASAEPDIVDKLHQVLNKAHQRLGAASLLSDYPHWCLVHSDHTYENWVINTRQAHLIDWEWAEIGSPAGDLGHFLSPVTICRRQGYQLPAADRTFFLDCYYAALGEALARIVQYHFAAFGPFPAVRSLCWTAGYWITAQRWYADGGAENASATERLARLEASRRQFPGLWQAVMDWLEEPVEV